MISKIFKNNNICKLVNYVINDKENGIENRADFVSSDLINSNNNNEITAQFKEVIDNYTNTKQKINHEATHIVLSFEENEQLEQDKLREIVDDYMFRMGYRNCPFYATVHKDTEHQHVHIATTKINYDRTLTSTSNEKWNGMSVCQDLERKHCLKANVRKKSRTRDVADDFSKLNDITKTKLDYLAKNKQFALKKLCSETGKDFTTQRFAKNIKFAYTSKDNKTVNVRLNNNKFLRINKSTLKAKITDHKQPLNKPALNDNAKQQIKQAQNRPQAQFNAEPPKQQQPQNEPEPVESADEKPARSYGGGSLQSLYLALAKARDDGNLEQVASIQAQINKAELLKQQSQPAQEHKEHKQKKRRRSAPGM